MEVVMSRIKRLAQLLGLIIIFGLGGRAEAKAAAACPGGWSACYEDDVCQGVIVCIDTTSNCEYTPICPYGGAGCLQGETGVLCDLIPE